MTRSLKTLLSTMLLTLGMALGLTLPARAVLEIDITQGVVEPMPSGRRSRR